MLLHFFLAVGTQALPQPKSGVPLEELRGSSASGAAAASPAADAGVVPAGPSQKQVGDSDVSQLHDIIVRVPSEGVEHYPACTTGFESKPLGLAAYLQ